MKNTDAILHVKGESIYIDDIITGSDVLFAGIFSSPVAHGKIKKLNYDEALLCEGIVDIITAKDIPGENQIGGIIPDEVLLPEDTVHFIGEPIAIVVAESKSLALKACQKIEIEIEPLPVITDPRKAFEKGDLIDSPHTFLIGDTSKMWDKCDVVVEGKVESGAQEHFYLEPQGAIAYPVEQDRIKVISSTQSPTAVQRTIARVLGLGMHDVEVDVRRLGGAFGGKEDQATLWAALAALAAFKLKRSVKLTLNRSEDIVMTGKRHPYSSDYKIGLTSDGKILAYEVMFFQNAGACADLSTAILHRTLFHCTNSYNIPNVKATAAPCRTNLHPFTAFRGFGGPQGMLVIETAIYKAARKLGIDPKEIQKKNLLNEGNQFPYGMEVENCKAEQCFSLANSEYNINKIYEDVDEFNSKNNMYKKGVSLMPICFGISFTATFLNQASSLVHVYTDGSVSLNTAAVEMGQGVNIKMIQIAARAFSINHNRLRIESTNTSRVANTSPTAASASADLNGEATRLACEEILTRLKKVAADILEHEDVDDIYIKDEIVYCKDKKTDLNWDKLVNDAYFSRVNLSSHAHYATPDLYFDNKMEKGKPFAYHVFGTAVTEVTLNCLTGTYEIDRVNVVHDAGESLDKLIDLGQVEGGLVQGIGWLTIEDLQYDEKGKLLSDTASSLKIPDMKSTPREVKVKFLENSNNPRAIFNSKAIGEPPFMYGIGTIMALNKAIDEFRERDDKCFVAPLTPERVLKYLYK